MNQSQSRTIRYAVAGLCGLTLLLFIGWLVLREPRPPSDQQPVRVVTAAPRAHREAPLVTLDDDAPHETPATNQVAEAATTNAATFYQQAFALYDALTKEQKGLIGNWRTNVDAAAEAELCEKLQPICDLMHQAAAASSCDWGLEQPITGLTRFPYLSPCRNLARAAIWSVAHCRTGDTPAAVDDLVAASRVGQHVSSPPTLIGHLVDLAIQGMVIESATAHASILVSAGDTRLMEQLNDRNYDEGLGRAFEQGADTLTREADRLAALPPEEMKHQLEELESFESDPSRFQSLEPAQIIADIRQAADLQRQYAQALDLPDAEYRAWLTTLDEAGKANPFVEVLVTPFGKAVDKTQAMTVMSAMAVAGLAVVQSGTGALQSYPDPSTGQPFSYARTADGFELQSSFQFLDKPMKLTFK
jgi:hypothetical protein